MALRTRSIHDSPSLEDGIRISVMSRHTLADGKTPDERIIEGISFVEWMPELAPLPQHVGMYYRKEMTYEQLEREYRALIRRPDRTPLVAAIAQRALTETITLCCSEPTVSDPAELKCHRKALAEECRYYQPSLTIVIK